MAPLDPHWQQPSHPAIQEVVINKEAFTSKSLSKVERAPFAVYAKLDFPPCTIATEPTYATVQMGRDSHLNLNSDLVYINHSCDPSLIFDMGSMNILAGPKGLRPGDELTFFYPSTEWHMAQPFACLCGKASCRGTISGARDMSPLQLQGVWLNTHIRELLGREFTDDPTAVALTDALIQAEKVVDAARIAVRTYAAAAATKASSFAPGGRDVFNGKWNGGGVFVPAEGLNRRGPSSRELSGEMGGDTVA